MISFTAKTNDFKKALSMLKALFKHQRVLNIKVPAELNMVDGHVTVSVPGGSFGFNAETRANAKAFLPFGVLYSLVDQNSLDLVTVEFYDTALRIGLSQVPAKTILSKNTDDLRTIQLPIDYKQIDVLRLKKQGYSDEEIAYNNLTELIAAAERKIDYDAVKAGDYLNEYGITNRDIKKLIRQKIDGEKTESNKNLFNQ